MKKLLGIILSAIMLIACFAVTACNNSGGGSLKVKISAGETSDTSAQPTSEEQTGNSSENEGGSEEGPVAPATCTVTFLSDGELYYSCEVEKGTAVSAPATDPEKDGYYFTDWKKNGLMYDFDLPVTSDLTLTAGYRGEYTGVLTDVLGSFSYSDGVYMNTGGLSMAINKTDRFNYGTLEVDVVASRTSDNGIIVCCESPYEKFNEGEGISYYFFFLGIGGTVYLGKSVNGSWSALRVYQLGTTIVEGKTYTLKVIIDGTNMSCYIDGKLYILFSETTFLHGAGYGIRSGAAGITFTNFRVTEALEY